jgi:pimeloyl-ACP methyl ester carboxylesterase
MAELTLQWDGGPVRAWVRGPDTAPVVLLLHPYPLSGDCWTGLGEALAAAGLRALAFDAPGFGGSPARGRPLSVDGLAQIAARALSAVGAARCALVGCSMGGYAAMAFARLFPERLRQLCLMNTKASPDSAGQREGREAQARLALEQGAAAVTGPLLPKLLSPGLAERDPRLWQQLQGLAAGATAQGLADALRGLAARPDAAPQLRLSAAPALVVAGEHDQITPRAEMEALAALLPRARFELVAGAGHLSFLERPTEVAGLLTAALRPLLVD